MNNLKGGSGGQVFNLRLSDVAMSQLREIAQRHRVPADDVVRLGISLAKIALEAREGGHKLVVATQAGDPLRDVVLPSLLTPGG